MKLHIITIGEPKLAYARAGWKEYFGRLKHYHDLRVTHISDKQNNTKAILQSAGESYKVALVKEGVQLASPGLAQFLEKRSLESREVSFVIGGPDGLPAEVLDKTDYQLSFSQLTFPHDLAMVILLEALYRASTITAGTPYHK
jgi:23S rRNA (pseudouridine1915-N3)-methyltransferase